MQRSLELLSLFTLIVLVTLRSLVPETYDSSYSSITAALDPITGPTPLRTLVFDLLILSAVCGWLLARALGPNRQYRWTGLEWGAGLIAIASLVSCLAAGNKSLALNASIDWLCYPLMTIVLVQLMRGDWHRRLLVAAVVAAGCVQAVECFDQSFLRFEDTWQHYESIKHDFWAGQGVDLDSAKVEQFEMRMKAGEAQGFLPHSNVTGSFLILCGFTALGVAISRWRRVSSLSTGILAGVCTIIAAALLGATLLTKSVGAIVAATAGGALWITLGVLSPWISVHRGKAFILGWACVALGAVAVVGHGWYHGSFPHMSLTFRWHYWSASGDMVADRPLTGVGRENFRRHYLKYKSVESPEEVANPHNLFVQAAADWGLPGLVGLIVLMVGASWTVTGPVREPGLSAEEPRAGPGRNALFAWTALLALALTVVRLPLLGTDDPHFLYYATVVTALVWIPSSICFAAGADRSPRPGWSSARPGSTGVAIGLFAFLLHDMINFAMFVPSTATVFFALLAVRIAERPPLARASAMPNMARRWVPFVGAAGLTAAVAGLVVMPAARAADNLARARQAVRHTAPAPVAAQLANHYYLEAARNRFDSTPHGERAEWLLAMSSMPEHREEAFPLAEESLDIAIARDPFSLRLRRLQSRLYLSWAGFSGRSEHYDAAIGAAEASLQLYPLDPAGIVALAECQSATGQATESRELLRKAIENYERALALDDARPEWAVIRQIRDAQREAIHGELRRIRQVLSVGP